MIVKAIRPNAEPAARGSASAMAILRDPRVQYFDQAGNMQYRLPAPGTGIPITVVVTVDEMFHVEDMLRCLTRQRYDSWEILIVCTDPVIKPELLQLVTGYRPYLPLLRVFVTAKQGSLADALNAANQNVTTEYWCRLDAADFMHTAALRVVAAAIQEQAADCYYTCRYNMYENAIVRPKVMLALGTHSKIWSGEIFPFSPLLTYKNSTIIQLGGFKTFDNYPEDATWIMAYKMLASGLVFYRVGAAIYFKRDRLVTAKTREKVSPVEYRAALLALHWPEHALEISDEKTAD